MSAELTVDESARTALNHFGRALGIENIKIEDGGARYLGLIVGNYDFPADNGNPSGFVVCRDTLTNQRNYLPVFLKKKNELITDGYTILNEFSNDGIAGFEFRRREGAG